MFNLAVYFGVFFGSDHIRACYTLLPLNLQCSYCSTGNYYHYCVKLSENIKQMQEVEW